MENSIETNQQLVWKALPVKKGLVGYPKISANLTKDITEEIKGISIIPINFKKKRELSYRKKHIKNKKASFTQNIKKPKRKYQIFVKELDGISLSNWKSNILSDLTNEIGFHHVDELTLSINGGGIRL
jgi:hypothetical protein